MTTFKQIWPLVAASLVAQIVVGSTSSYIAIAVMRNDIAWIQTVLSQHEQRLELLENENSLAKYRGRNLADQDWFYKPPALRTPASKAPPPP